MKSKLERIIEFYPAYDKRSKNPKKNYGIHCVNAIWEIKGKEGAITFTLFTGWFLPEIQKELRLKKDVLNIFPMPVDITYHSLTPMYKGQKSYGECNFLEKRKCYCDGSGMRAERFYETLTIGGGEALWNALEVEYLGTFS